MSRLLPPVKISASQRKPSFGRTTQLKVSKVLRSHDLKIGGGLMVSFLVVVGQWLVVMSFVQHSYTWWLKAGDPVIDAGIAGTVIFALGSATAIGFSLWAHDWFYQQKSRLKYAAQIGRASCRER